nr:nuclear receptor coactivator 6-like [Lytechinus pictus]
MGKETPRKRSKDFQRVEVEALLQFVATRKHELFGTGGKGSSKEEKLKERTWKRATHSLRAAGGQEREWHTLRKKWRDMASKAKAYKAPRTGGGPPPENNDIHERVLAILAKEVVNGILPEDEQNSQDSEATDLSLYNEDVSGPSGYQCQPLPQPQPQPLPQPQPQSLPQPQPQPQPRSIQSNQSREILTQRPAQIRQLEIQEELLRIQQAKLIVKQKQLHVSESILEELRSIHNTLANQPSAIDLLNSTQQGRY